jgi:transposase
MDNLTTIGIDVAKNYLDICIMPSGKTLRVANTQDGFKKLIQALRHHKDVFRIVLEHTGGYQQAIVAYLQKYELPVSVINPSRARHFAKASGQIAKTDTIDAENLALFGLFHKPKLTEPEDESVVLLRQLVHRRGQIIKMMVSEKNRIDKEPCIEVKNSIDTVLGFLDEELKRISVQIHAIVDSDEVLRSKSEIMQSVKGIGKESAAILIAELPELGHVGRQQISSLTGLAPMNRDSGNKKGRAYIQAGRKNARSALYMPIISAIRYNSVIRMHYENLIGHGKPKKVALIACMRKMLVHLNSLLAKEIYNNEKINEKKLNFCLT